MSFLAVTLSSLRMFESNLRTAGDLPEPDVEAPPLLEDAGNRLQQRVVPTLFVRSPGCWESLPAM